jgi:hypothetical protein
MEHLKLFLLVFPILVLLGSGTLIALRSGPVGRNSPPGVFEILANLSSTMLIVAGAILTLGVFQRLAGLRIWSIWSG